MINGARKPNKSAAERELDAAMAEYEEHFGEEFVVDFADDFRTMEETTAYIRRLISEDRKQETPEYVDGAIY